MIPHGNSISYPASILALPRTRTTMAMNLRRSYTKGSPNSLHFSLQRHRPPRGLPHSSSRTIPRLTTFLVRFQEGTFTLCTRITKPIPSNRPHRNHPPFAGRRRRKQSGDRSRNPHLPWLNCPQTPPLQKLQGRNGTNGLIVACMLNCSS